MAGCSVFFAVLAISVITHGTRAISLTHYDRPISTITREAPKISRDNLTLATNERQRRLLPYMTYYVGHDINKPLPQYRLVTQKHAVPSQQIKLVPPSLPKFPRQQLAPAYNKLVYTQFENNKIPVQFTPVPSQPLRAIPSNIRYENEGDFAAIYNKLVALKQGNKQLNNEQHLTRNHAGTQSSAVKFLLDQYPQNQGQRYKPLTEEYKTIPNQYKTIQDFRPITDYKPYIEEFELVTETYKNSPEYKLIQPKYKFQDQYKPLQIPAEIPKRITPSQQLYEAIKPKQVQPVRTNEAIKQIQEFQHNAQLQYKPTRGQVKTTIEEIKPVPQFHREQFKPTNIPVKTTRQPEYHSIESDQFQPIQGYKTHIKTPIAAKPIPEQYQTVLIKPEEFQNHAQFDNGNSQYQSVLVQLKANPELLQPITKPYNPPIQYESNPEVKQYQPIKQPPKAPAPSKTVHIHTYTPTEIDISNDENYKNFEPQRTHNQIPSPPNDFTQTVTIKNEDYKTEAAITKIDPIVVQTIFRPSPEIGGYDHTYYRNQDQASQYAQETEVTTIPVSHKGTENPHSLSVILKHLQDNNMLPQTLTPDNIDNSIKTLVYILNTLKTTKKFQKPIVVADTVTNQQSQEEINDDLLSHTVTQNFPANTVDGGTPGKPGIDYPAYSVIPQTRFNCKEQRYKGFFGDPETNCQVWHYCDLNGGQASFLCPNGTIFSQVALTCDWWYNVKCATTTQLYVLNERLYKYILPFNPKFPEDYSGPLVDRYLALKFQEMEEKMKKQKKGKDKTDDTSDSVDKLQIIERETGHKRDTSPETKTPKK